MKGPPAPRFQVVRCKGKRWFACLSKEEKSVWPSSKPPVCVGKWKSSNTPVNVAGSHAQDGGLGTSGLVGSIKWSSSSWGSCQARGRGV